MSYQVCEPLYSTNLLAEKKKVINQGGTSSAKTYTILQVLFTIACRDASTRITVVGQDVPNLKKGAIRDALTILSSSPFLQSRVMDYKNTKGYNKTERIIQFKNGSFIEFNSYDNEQDAKSGKRDYLFINEANGIDHLVYFQLSIRTEIREFLDYNPTARFWVHEKLIGKDDCQLIISDHRHNRFLTAARHQELEDIKNIDEELWKVYARGMTGQIRGLIYPTITIIDSIPGIFDTRYGLDFGYNHKTALVEVAHDANRLFWNELIYQTELTVGDLIPMMKELNLGKKRIAADHAAADKIEDLIRAGFNVVKADKEVKNGIDFVKRNQLFITKNSHGLKKERLSYKWKEKKETGEPTDEPVKFNDDGMDAGRYGSYTFRKATGIKVASTTATTEDQAELDYV